MKCDYSSVPEHVQYWHLHPWMYLVGIGWLLEVSGPGDAEEYLRPLCVMIIAGVKYSQPSLLSRFSKGPTNALSTSPCSLIYWLDSLAVACFLSALAVWVLEHQLLSLHPCSSSLASESRDTWAIGLSTGWFPVVDTYTPQTYSLTSEARLLTS